MHEHRRGARATALRLNVVTVLLFGKVVSIVPSLGADPPRRRQEWPRTDFSRHSVPFGEIKSGGPPRGGIPPIDLPRFDQLADGKPMGWSAALAPTEPVIALAIAEDPRAYPLRVLIWHEIVNDLVGDARLSSPTARCAMRLSSSIAS